MQYNEHNLKIILEKDFMSNPNVFKPGHRNDDAVDMCCIAWCLDMDPHDALLDLARTQSWCDHDYNLAEEHVNRVMDYIPNWGKRGTMEAMDYAIDY